jgi:hypothetical protein
MNIQLFAAARERVGWAGAGSSDCRDESMDESDLTGVFLLLDEFFALRSDEQSGGFLDIVIACRVW